MRSGSILGVLGGYSKPHCHCARPGDPGHGPNSRLTRKVKGKTVAETLSSPAAWYKAQREVAEFGKFRELNARLLELNQALGQRRPAVEEENLSGVEKNGAGYPSLPRPSASGGGDARSMPQRPCQTESLDEGPPKAPAQ